MSLIIAIPRERRTSERRVALDPSRVERLLQEGMHVRIEAECGHSASFHDEDYVGVTVVDSFQEVVRGADIVVKVVCPTLEEIACLQPHTVLVCIMSAFQHLDEIKALRDRHITVLAMDHLPRTTRAQPMDALSSQATVAGYKAALLAAELSPRLFPMLTTAAGTIRPSRVLVIGAGVAGLQAIATSKRLGAQVEAYDIRRAAKEQIESVGARMVDTGVEVEGAGGFARALRKDEKQKQHDVLAEHLARAHVVICAAAIPGRRAPRIITEDMVDGMLPESIIVDLAASTGGNCELTRIGEHYYHNDVLIVGPLNLPSHGAVHASEMYARNVYNMLHLIIVDNNVILDPEDEIIARCVLLHDGVINDANTARQLDVEPVAFGGAVHAALDTMPDQSSGWLEEESTDEIDGADEAKQADAVAIADEDSTSQLDESRSATADSITSGTAGSILDESRTGQRNTLAVENEAAVSAELPGSNPAIDSDAASGRDTQALSGQSDNDASPDSELHALDELQDDEALRDLARLDGLTELPDEPTDGSDSAAVQPRDDLTQIDGIGPALQERLYAFGFHTFEQLADLDDEGAEKLSVQLELNNEIAEQDWPGQARQLMEDGQ